MTIFETLLHEIINGKTKLEGVFASEEELVAKVKDILKKLRTEKTIPRYREIDKSPVKAGYRFQNLRGIITVSFPAGMQPGWDFDINTELINAKIIFFTNNHAKTFVIDVEKNLKPIIEEPAEEEFPDELDLGDDDEHIR